MGGIGLDKVGKVREQKRPSVEKPAGLKRRVLVWEQEEILSVVGWG